MAVYLIGYLIKALRETTGNGGRLEGRDNIAAYGTKAAMT